MGVKEHGHNAAAVLFSCIFDRRDYAGAVAYSKLQQKEFAAQELGYRAVTQQRFVGTGYFDEIVQVVSGGHSSTTALAGPTKAAQFHVQPNEHFPSKVVPAGQTA